MVSGPLFIVAVLIQDFTRPGFNPVDHPLSLHGTGDLGWIQITNFVLTGLLNIGFAIGLRRASLPAQKGRCGSLLIAGHGVGLIIAGVFVTDPDAGFPPGVPPPAEASLSHSLHGIGALLAFGSLVGACFVFARRFAAQSASGWAVYSTVIGVAVLALFLSANIDEELFSMMLRAGVFLGWSWVSVLATRLMLENFRASSRRTTHAADVSRHRLPGGTVPLNLERNPITRQ